MYLISSNNVLFASVVYCQDLQQRVYCTALGPCCGIISWTSAHGRHLHTGRWSSSSAELPLGKQRKTGKKVAKANASWSMRLVSASSQQSAHVLGRSALRDFALETDVQKLWNLESGTSQCLNHHDVVGQAFGNLLISRPHTDACSLSMNQTVDMTEWEILYTLVCVRSRPRLCSP